MKNLKKIIIILILIIIVIAICLFVLNKNKSKNFEDNKEDEYGNYDESNIKPIINNNVQFVKNHSKFFAISDAIQKYYDYLTFDVDNIDIEKNTYEAVMAEAQKVNSIESKRKAIYSLLDVQYVKENSITENNVLEKISNINASVQFYPLYMNYLDGTVNQRFAVLGKIRLLEDKSKYKNVAFIVTVGRDTSLFMIKPLNEEYNNVEDIHLEEYNVEIDRNDYNILKYTTYTDNKIAQKYFSYYKEISHYDKEEIYNLMSNDYRQKRFGDETEFEKYIDSIEKNDSTISAQEYVVNTYDNYKEYVCKDQYDNLYIFKEELPMKFTIELDTYTLNNDKFTEKYNSSNDQYKVMMNIDKINQMMNARDYRTMFSYLDETFKNTYFENNVDIFESYMRKHFSSHYKVEYGNLTSEAGVYIQEITLKDMTDESKTIERTIYMKLNEGLDFRMSMNVYHK